MDIKFTVTHSAYCDIDTAYEEYLDRKEYVSNFDPDREIYRAVNNNVISEYDDVPRAVVEEFAKALRSRVGGVQLEMELD